MPAQQRVTPAVGRFVSKDEGGHGWKRLLKAGRQTNCWLHWNPTCQRSAYGRGTGCTLQSTPSVVWFRTGIPVALWAVACSLRRFIWV
jgi:hypothetical protein